MGTAAGMVAVSPPLGLGWLALAWAPAVVNAGAAGVDYHNMVSVGEALERVKALLKEAKEAEKRYKVSTKTISLLMGAPSTKITNTSLQTTL